MTTVPAGDLEALAVALDATFGPRLRRDEPLGPMTTYRVGGRRRSSSRSRPPPI